MVASSSMDFLEGLNPQQREAVCHVDGPLLILAGAGSGKTRVITHRIAYLIATVGVPGAAIWAVTFTNKAADEMRKRVAALAGAGSLRNPPWISTFHSFCVRLLRSDAASLADLRPGFTKQFAIYDEDDQLAVLKAVYRHHGLDEKFMQYRAALSRISFAKNQQQTPADMHASSSDPKTSRLALIFEDYENRLRQANALDFDDLLLEAVRLLTHDDSVRVAYNRRFRYLMVDEYQDTNRSQYQLMRLLSQEHKNVCVVGDEDQSIYGWRGADIRNILDFERDYPEARVIRLEQNYRSTKFILDAASALVAHNTERKGKWLWTDSAQGDPIEVYEAADGEQEALFIAEKIHAMTSQDPNSRVAVLYRTNSQSRQIEEALRRYNLRYHVVGGFSFYQRAEIRDALAYLRVLLSPLDSVSLLRIINTPARGIGRSTIEQAEIFSRNKGLPLWSALVQMVRDKMLPTRAAASVGAFINMIEELREASASAPVHVVLQSILDRTGYWKMLESDDRLDSENRRENLSELLNAALDASERGEDIQGFLDHAALVSETDNLDEQAQILLLTLHNAKGLEFPYVFIAGMEEKLFPHARSFSSDALMEEERRLCYVGMTRAQKQLFLTWARERRRFGGGAPEPCQPSRFLSEIPAKLTVTLKSPEGFRGIDFVLESRQVRNAVGRVAFTGKTCNSLEHIRQFFSERAPAMQGKPAAGTAGAAEAVSAAATPSARKPARRKGLVPGATIEHPVYGKGTVMRREGEGENAKITVSFPGYGLKKLVEKYARVKIEE